MIRLSEIRLPLSALASCPDTHADIEQWRLKQALGRTWLRRPELLARRSLSARERALLEEFQREHEHESSKA